MALVKLELELLNFKVVWLVVLYQSPDMGRQDVSDSSNLEE